MAVGALQKAMPRGGARNYKKPWVSEEVLYGVLASNVDLVKDLGSYLLLLLDDPQEAALDEVDLLQGVRLVVPLVVQDQPHLCAELLPEHRRH